MDRLESFANTYSQAPWRKQLQIVGLFLSAMVFLALVAGIYLNVSARAATTGREIQDLQKASEEAIRDNEDLRSRLAIILSSNAMEKRAMEMGFEPVNMDQIVYLKVPGYTDRQGLVLAPYSERSIVGARTIPPEYTESLFVWIERQVDQLSLSFFQVEE